jgi:hypothetical protein
MGLDSPKATGSIYRTEAQEIKSRDQIALEKVKKLEKKYKKKMRMVVLDNKTVLETTKSDSEFEHYDLINAL